MNELDQAKSVITFCNDIGLAISPSAGDAILDYLAQGKPPPMIAAIIVLQHVAIDYLAGAIPMVRSTDTALLCLKLLKEKAKLSEISQHELQIAAALFMPFFEPGPEATKRAHQIVADLGSEPLSDCFRPQSEREREAQKILSDGYKDYLKSHQSKGLP